MLTLSRSEPPGAAWLKVSPFDARLSLQKAQAFSEPRDASHPIRREAGGSRRRVDAAHGHMQLRYSMDSVRTQRPLGLKWWLWR